MRDVLALENHVAGGRFHQFDDGAERGLAAAAFPDQPDGLARFDGRTFTSSTARTNSFTLVKIPCFTGKWTFRFLTSSRGIVVVSEVFRVEGSAPSDRVRLRSAAAGSWRIPVALMGSGDKNGSRAGNCRGWARCPGWPASAPNHRSIWAQNSSAPACKDETAAATTPARARVPQSGRHT